MKTLTLIFSIVTFCASCQPIYWINKDSISSSASFDLRQGFIIEKIKVDSVYQHNEDGKIYVDSLGNFRRTVEKKIGYPITYVVDTAFILEKDEKARNINTIFFHRKNKGYYWIYWRPFLTDDEYDSLPINFIPGQWYHIRNLTGDGGGPSYHIYLHIKSDGTFEKFEKDKPGPW